MNGMFKDNAGYYVYFKIEEDLEVMGVVDDRGDWWLDGLDNGISEKTAPKELNLPEEYLL